MNWERFENIMRQEYPSLPDGLIDRCVSIYRGEHLDIGDTQLSKNHEKIVRDSFVKESDRPDARDHSRAFISWAHGQGYDFKVNEFYKNAGNIGWMVNQYWEAHDEEEKVSSVTDPRIRYIFKRLSFWSKRDRLYFLTHHDPSKLNYYAFFVYDARQEIVEDQDSYVSARNVLAPSDRMESLFKHCNKCHDWESVKFWEAVVDKDWKGGPKRRPEWTTGTPEYDKRRRG